MKANQLLNVPMPEKYDNKLQHLLAEAQFFDFGYVSHEQIIEESAVAFPAFYEGFLRLPADICVFEHSWHPDTNLVHSVYVFSVAPENPDTNLLGIEFRFVGNGSLPTYTGMTIELEQLTPAAKVDWHMKGVFRARVRHRGHTPGDLKGYVSNLFTPLACMLGRLNARGIERKYIEPAEKLNKARRKKGKHPLVSYTKVKVAPYRPPLGHSGPRDDDYTPKRYHFRRGHLRHFANGEQTWVTSCFVGCPEDGEVKHTYEVLE